MFGDAMMRVAAEQYYSVLVTVLLAGHVIRTHSCVSTRAKVTSRKERSTVAQWQYCGAQPEAGKFLLSKARAMARRNCRIVCLQFDLSNDEGAMALAMPQQS
eukprot:3096856-Rhodomonas_salina.2